MQRCVNGKHHWDRVHVRWCSLSREPWRRGDFCLALSMSRLSSLLVRARGVPLPDERWSVLECYVRLAVGAT